MKTCNKCQLEKPESMYGKDVRNKGGLQGICEVCRKEAKQKSRDLRQVGINTVFIREKKCNSCGAVKLIGDFFKDSGIMDGHSTICKACKTKSSLAWRAANRGQYNASQRAYHKKYYTKLRLTRYDLTPEQHEEMLKAQGGVCKICNKPPQGSRPLCVDHDHVTGKVRGLLCYGCNRLMVLLDTPELLASAGKYKNKA